MKKPKAHKQNHPRSKQTTPTHSVPKQADVEQKHIDELPSVEWGDRINSGKSIARGGKDDGFVPGAMPAR